MTLISTPKIGTIPPMNTISRSMPMKNKSMASMITNTKSLKRKTRIVNVSTILKC